MKQILILLISFLFLLIVGCSNTIPQSTEPEITTFPTVNSIEGETLAETTASDNTLPSAPAESTDIDDENVTTIKPTENTVTPSKPTIPSNNDSNNKLCQHKNIYPANCVNPGYCYDCKVILEEKNPNIHPDGQEHGLYNIKVATCAEEGYTGDLKCKSCYSIIEYGKVTPKLNTHYTFYNENKATCCKLAKCEICGINYGECDSNNHSHQFITKNKVEPTCSKGGYSGDLCCKDCEIIIYPGKTININPVNHLDITTKNKNIPIYPCQEGYTGDTYCTDCKKIIEQGKQIQATTEHKQEIRGAIPQASLCCTGYSGDIYCSVCDIKLQNGKTIKPTMAHTWSTKYLTNPYTVQNTCARCQIVENTVLSQLDISYVGTVDNKMYFEPVNEYVGIGHGYTKLTYTYSYTSDNGYTSTASNSSGASYIPKPAKNTIITVTISEYTNNVAQKPPFRKVTKHFDTSTNSWV